MKNNSTTLFKAYKLYTGGSIVKTTLLTVIVAFIGYVFIKTFLFSSEENAEYLALCMCGFAVFFGSSYYIFCSSNVRLRGMVFCTVKDCIGMNQKFHLASTLSGIAIIIFSYALFALYNGFYEETVIICLYTLLIRAVANIFCLIRHDAARTIVYCVFAMPIFIAVWTGSMLILERTIKLEFGLEHIFIAAAAIVIFAVTEWIIMKSIRKNWYKD